MGIDRYPPTSPGADIPHAMPSADGNRLAEVSGESLAGWDDFCDRYGVPNRTVLAEVIGLALAQMTGSLEELPEPVRAWVYEARALRRQRASRKPKESR